MITAGSVLISALLAAQPEGLSTLQGACRVEEASKLLASDGAAGDWFGVSTSIDGTAALVGALFDDVACPNDPRCNSGSAYVFRRRQGNWEQEAKLVASDTAAYDRFGISVSLDGDTALVGADWVGSTGFNTYDGLGAVYVFHFAGASWAQTGKLTASDAQAGDWFGWSTALYANMAVVGAFRDDDADPDDPNCDSGAVYVFRWNGSQWDEVAKLRAQDASCSAWFGVSVALTGDRIVVGALDFLNGGSGSAYVFRFDGSVWTEEAKLVASNGAESDHFGTSVAIDNDVIVVGSPGNDTACPKTQCNSGSAYVFRFDGSNWIEKAALLASDTAWDDRFGASVFIEGDLLGVGAYGDSLDQRTNVGSVYLFRFDGKSWWMEQAKLVASDGNENDWLGSAVAVSQDFVLAGARARDDHCPEESECDSGRRTCLNSIGWTVTAMAGSMRAISTATAMDCLTTANPVRRTRTQMVWPMLATTVRINSTQTSSTATVTDWAMPVRSRPGSAMTAMPTVLRTSVRPGAPGCRRRCRPSPVAFRSGSSSRAPRRR